MLARSPTLQARLLPKGWLDVLRQVALFGIAYMGYSLVRGAANGKAAAAFTHAREVISVERTLHFFVEPSVQTWASGSHFVAGTASWIYVNAQTSVTIGALVFLYLFRNRSFYFVRNMFLVAMVLALLGYIVFPTAPPRFMPEWGFFDSVSDVTGVAQDNSSVNAFFNAYAAVPSMHVGFAVMVGLSLFKLVRFPAVRVFWLLYPLLITFVTVATANHFLADAILGAVTAGAAAYVARWLARTRPNAWRFAPPAAAEARAAA
ncbi:MAG: inositol phosphorylceramide synthase [Actinobacteria bacterium]|nr:MAG: inositol phosphorylceramide synthase [Actinomycetota bacterium]